MNKEVNKYLNNPKKWQAELNKLHDIIIDVDLREEFKWMHPCYTDKGKNIVLIHGFKDYCAILFHKGALLKDPEKILVQQTENTQSARQIRFTDISEIEEFEPIIRQYLKEAIDMERKGLKAERKKVSEYETPKELALKFEEDLQFKKAFKSLTIGRQKGYLLYFSKPKRSKTKILLIEKSKNRILNGFGLNDCICGKSKRMPNCDGSHKALESKK